MRFNILIIFFLIFYNYNEQALAQDLKLYGETKKTVELPTLDFDHLIPKNYLPKLIYENNDNSAMQGVSTCQKWKELSNLSKSQLGKDKFTQIDIGSIENICWLVELIKNSKTTNRRIDVNDSFSTPEFFPAGLAYNGFLLGKEYVKDNSIQPKNRNDLSLEISLYFATNAKQIREFIWSKQSKSLEELALELFQPSMSGLAAQFSINKVSTYRIDGIFLRNNFRVTIVATGFDIDKDAIEDWAIINEISDVTGNWSACYPAIISRKISADNQSFGPFIIKQSKAALRCG